LPKLTNVVCKQDKLPAKGSLNLLIKSKIAIHIIAASLPCRAVPYNTGFIVGISGPAKPFLLAAVPYSAHSSKTYEE
jgi:hypothetical protein